jgi:dipeptidyl aminopeptidase/acylaminoacyl peptidase
VLKNACKWGGPSESRRALGVAILIWVMALRIAGQTVPKRPFTIADDIGLAQFQYAGEGVASGGPIIKFSPDGRVFAVVTERGALEQNAPEDTIWIFRSTDVEKYLRGPGAATPAAVPLVRMAGDKDGPIIGTVKWLSDSSGLAFTALVKNQQCRFHQLFVADIKTSSVKPLSPENEDVDAFDVRNSNYVYEVSAPAVLKAPEAEDDSPAVALTGKDIWSVIFPSKSGQLTPFDRAGLWAVVGGKKFRVIDAETNEPLNPGSDMTLSPDGHSIVAILPVKDYPKSWTRYKPPPGYEEQTKDVPVDSGAYQLIDLQKGTKRILVNAPTGRNGDWHSYMLAARWSADSQSILLPDSFFPLDVSDPAEVAKRESQPFVAVLRLGTGELSAVLPVKAGLDKQRYAVSDMRFEDDRTVVIDYDRLYFLPNDVPSAVFHQEADGSWKQVSAGEDPRMLVLPFKLNVRESINEPPAIVAQDRLGGSFRVIWDPNPQLNEINLGSAEVIHGKDASGHEWEAGLVKPPNFLPGKRYPMVIQTHGFVKGQFLTNGIFASAFAARALAAAGIVVVQLQGNEKNIDTPNEGRGEVVLYQSVIEKLSDEGLVDPAKVGAIGFSRTVYHVLCALTNDVPLLAAASVTDGVNFGYFEYLSSLEDGLAREADAINGGKPLDGAALKNWIARSPEFNMERASAPLLLLMPGRGPVVADWEPYAVLRYLDKPVDLVMIQPGTHVMTNPRQRFVSESTNVDWFRFWLKDEEDPDPTKADQYARWRELRKLQEQGQRTAPPN